MGLKLPQPCLCLVTDRRTAGENTLVQRVVEAVIGGVDLVQLREKDLPGGKLLKMACNLKEAIGDSALLIINERVDVAAASGAAGVQLGEEALPVSAARAILGQGPLIGRSVHTPQGAAQAVAQGADFLLVGTMFATGSHPRAKPAGPGLVRDIADRWPIPLIGIGGINAANLEGVMRAGAQGVAVISSIMAAPDARQAARQLKEAMLAAWSFSPVNALSGEKR